MGAMSTVENLPASTKAKSFLKWVGGKSQLLSQLEPHFPKRFKKYHEPFMGSAAVFFGLRPANASLADSNAELVNAFLQVQGRHYRKLIDLLSVHKIGHSADPKAYYYGVRAQNPSDLPEQARAARFIYLNKTCFNGLYRVNMKGLFNVPMGAYSNPNILDESVLEAAHVALQGVAIQHIGYREYCLEQPKAGDFVYVDPPYAPLNRTSSFTSYTKDSFGSKEQEQLRDVCLDLIKRGCFVVQSNSNSPEIWKLYDRKEFKIEQVSARRAINSVASKRGAIKELVITNA